MTETDHRYQFGSPQEGWPMFDDKGRRIKTITHRYILKEGLDLPKQEGKLLCMGGRLYKIVGMVPDRDAYYVVNITEENQ